MDINTLLSFFKHKTKIQIRFKDIDKLGHVNNANHLTYFETARTDYFKDVFQKKGDWIETGIILAKTEITYKQPILLEDTVYCYTKVTRFGTKSFDIEHVLVTDFNNKTSINTFGKSVLVCINYNTKETIPIPQKWVELVNSFEP